jgi:predicted phosphodiesterase
MLIGILSDIHDNLPNLEKALKGRATCAVYDTEAGSAEILTL